MTARRRGVRRRAYDPALFLTGDGFSYSLLSGEPRLPSRAAAEAAWQRCRPQTWQLWIAHGEASVSPRTSPPEGARAHDGLVGPEAGFEYALEVLGEHRALVSDERVLDALDVFEDHLRWSAQLARTGVEEE